jgi:hypothetical protein
MVLANKRYDAKEGFAREGEIYFTVSRKGSPRTDDLTYQEIPPSPQLLEVALK